MKLARLIPLALALFAACSLDRNEPDPATAGTSGSAGAGAAGTSGASSGGTGGGGMGGRGPGGGNGGRAGSDGSGTGGSENAGSTGEAAGAAGDEASDAGSGGGSGEGSGGSAGESSAGSSGSDDGGTSGTSNSGSGGGGSGGNAGGGGSGGNAGSGGQVSDTPIQRIQDGTVGSTDPVTIYGVRVTAVRTQLNGSTNLAVQEPQGSSPDGIDYPAYSGVRVYAPGALGTELGMSEAIVGDCVRITGTVGEFSGTTEISQVTMYETLADAECGPFPTPLLPPFADIATDVDLATSGDQPGEDAELYESVLLRVNNVEVSSIAELSAGVFRVRSGSADLAISQFLYDTFPSVSVGHQFASIVGLYDQFNNYRLQPRDENDITF